MERIANIIREKRQSLGLSMEKVAYKSGVSYRTILYAEHGKPITVTTLCAILSALGMELDIKDRRRNTA